MDDRNNRLAAARHILLQRLETLQRAGVEQIGELPIPLGAVGEPTNASRRCPEPGEGNTQKAKSQTLTPTLSQREREPLSTPIPASPPRPLSPSSSPAPSMLSSLIQPYPADLPDAL